MIESAKRCICTLKEDLSLGEILETLRQNCHAYFKEAIYFSLYYMEYVMHSQILFTCLFCLSYGVLTSKILAVEPLCFFFFLSLRLHYLFTQVREGRTTRDQTGICVSPICPHYGSKR